MERATSYLLLAPKPAFLVLWVQSSPILKWPGPGTELESFYSKPERLEVPIRPPGV